MPQRVEKRTIWVCSRCKHEWESKDGSKPVCCAKCKSPYWDREPKFER